jgi:hypothetical protein
MLPPKNRLHLFCMMTCLLPSAGCLGPSGIPGSNAVVTTLPTNEPSPLPTGVPTYIPQPAATIYPPLTQPIPYVTPLYPTVRATPYPARIYMPYQRASYLPYGARFPASISDSPEPSDPSVIAFSHYTDPFFSVDYPPGMERHETRICPLYQRERTCCPDRGSQQFFPGFLRQLPAEPPDHCSSGPRVP